MACLNYNCNQMGWRKKKLLDALQFSLERLCLDTEKSLKLNLKPNSGHYYRHSKLGYFVSLGVSLSVHSLVIICTGLLHKSRLKIVATLKFGTSRQTCYMDYGRHLGSLSLRSPINEPWAPMTQSQVHRLSVLRAHLSSSYSISFFSPSLLFYFLFFTLPVQT